MTIKDTLAIAEQYEHMGSVMWWAAKSEDEELMTHACNVAMLVGFVDWAFNGGEVLQIYGALGGN